jgi:signal transduction histidine kinase
VRRLELEARWARAFHLIFYACLAIPTLALSNAGPAAGSGGSRLVTTGIAVAMGAWYWWFIARRPRLPERLVPGALRFVVLLAFLVVLQRRDPSYSTVVYGVVPQPYLLLPGRWAYAGAAVLVVVWAAVNGLIRDGGLDGAGLWNLAGNLALILVVGWFINTIARQSEEQRAMLAELTRARARLAEQSRQAGILEERGRLAREIHDTLAQGLSGVVTQLEATEQALPHDPDRGRGHLAAAKRLARDTLAEARRSVEALRPEPLEGTRLDEALATVASRWSATTGVTATVTVTGSPRQLPVEVETALLRAAQEGLANAAKYAGAERVALTLSYMDEQVTLDVVDDGAGFDAASVSGGHGLAGMRERAARLAGALTVESDPGQGTALCLSIPTAPMVRRQG